MMTGSLGVRRARSLLARFGCLNETRLVACQMSFPSMMWEQMWEHFFCVGASLNKINDFHKKLAGGWRFEPTVRLRARRFSRPVYSTTLAPLRGSMVCNQAGCRDNKCRGFGQEEPIWLTRACALLPPYDAGLRTQKMLAGGDTDA